MAHEVPQRTQGDGKEPEHTHPATMHSHDHWHVSHHYKGGLGDDFEHRAYWHTHEHNHNEIVHSHDYSRDDEEAHHGQEAHIHDTSSPSQSPG